MKFFDFGQNWQEFVSDGVTEEQIAQARDEFGRLLESRDVKDLSFLDVGFGQGMTACLAIEKGARVTGIDVNSGCLKALAGISQEFPQVDITRAKFQIASILDSTTVEELEKLEPEGYDIVHSWGVLHHTGNMHRAITHCSRLVKPGGTLILAIYARHWTSPIWREIKKLYCVAPTVLQRVMIGIFYPIIWIAKLMATGVNPSKKERGMSFFFDVVDWVGGYPYEFASIEEIIKIGQALGLECKKAIAANTPIGCHEYIFIKRLENTAD